MPRIAPDPDSAALYERGRRLLTGDGAPCQPEEGAHWLAQAAEGGSVEAMATAATLAAAGVGRPQSWNEAFELLRRAGAGGHAKAAAQLRLIAAAWTPEGNPGEIDLAAWLTPPPRTVLSEAPRVRSFTGFLTPEICAWIVDLARDGLKPATMYNPTRRRDEPHPGRTNRTCVVDILRADVVFALVRARIAAAAKIPLPCFEPTQVFHYAVGQQIAPHYDFLESRTMTSYGVGEAYDGQRIATLLVYLNDGYEGGATTFPKVGVTFRGTTGDALLFANVDLEGQPDRLSLHAGAPPTRGDKWIISQWIHDRTFTGILQTG